MRFITLICLILFNTSLFADVDDTLAELQKAISEGDYSTAGRLFDKDTTELIHEKNFLDLCYFISYAGFIADHSDRNGMKAVEDFRDYILKSTDDLKARRQAYLEIHTYYRDIGKYQLAYNSNVRALEITHQIPGIEPRYWAIIERNLGVIASELNNPELAKSHILRASKGFDADPKTDESNKFNTLNSLGAIYWNEAQYDSVEYFWTKGLNFIDSMKPTLVNQFYYKSMIEGNLSALYDVTGRTDESIKYAKQSIYHIEYFTENGKNETRWNNAFLSLLYSSNNLAATYEGIGNYSQALKLYEFILKEKMDNYSANHPEIFFAEIQVGRANYDLKNFPEAKKWLKKGIEGYIKLGKNYDKNLADAYSTLAFIADEEDKTDEAESYYIISENKYSKVFQGKFDFVYLDFLTHISEFYSLNNKPEQAIELSKKGLEYISKSYSKNSLVGFRQNLNVGNVYYNLKDYKKAQQYAEEGLDILDNIKNSSRAGLDSLRTYFDKPSAILLKEKSAYYLEKNKSGDFLKQTLNKLKEAMSIVDKRKAILSAHEDQQMLTEQFKELIDFIKKIQLELFEKTGDTGYIDELLKLQEDMVYTKIRNQLNLVENLDFINVPKEITTKENEIKTELQNLFEEDGSLSDYLEKMNEWQEFLVKLKNNYPEYYKLRYTDLSGDSIMNSKSTQIVRYIFVESELLAVVFTKSGKRVYKLKFDPELINQISNVWDDPESLGKITSKLYHQLWEPFDTAFNEPRVMIIPDGVLFNLSFEILTPKPVSKFKDFSKNSLLATYDLSYHYSLWLAQNYGTKNIKSSYVGFVPGFSDQMKEKYIKSVTDSFVIDKTYLHLLPQPFTVKLVNKISKLFRGKRYVYEESTASAFKEKASGNKIIHIGTHAESDNISPAYSRLIFAKSDKHSDEDNSLYAYEIYGTDMTSNLTLLTACETGTPGYQPGEGMISFAHAFQYAGSESLLTSLWNQDEKAGMEISGYFLEFLSRGIAKDKALKKAKLKYLASNEGRTLSPQYWAGLILVGNPEPLKGLNSGTIWYWIGAGILFLFFVIYLFYKLKKRKKA